MDAELLAGLIGLFVALGFSIIGLIMNYKDKNLAGTEGDLHIKALIAQAQFLIQMGQLIPLLKPYADKANDIIGEFDTMWNDPKDRAVATEKLVADLKTVLEKGLAAYSDYKNGIKTPGN